MTTALEAVKTCLAAELDQQVFPEAAEAGGRLAARHSPTVAAVLFYGSGLRERSAVGKILDFYLLVDSYRAANPRWSWALGNTLLPPNVFYWESEIGGQRVRVKYGLLSVGAFIRGTRPRAFNPSFWARFSQPCALVWRRDMAAREMALTGLAQAVSTMVLRGAGPLRPPLGPLDIWRESLQRTYRAELRSEDAPAKAAELVSQAPDRYAVLAEPALSAAGCGVRQVPGGLHWPSSPLYRVWSRLRWGVRGLYGKMLSFLRLIKGAFTFEGGIDYLAWKMRRHSGVEIEVSDWHRRHPLLGGLTLYRTAKKRGAFR